MYLSACKHEKSLLVFPDRLLAGPLNTQRPHWRADPAARTPAQGTTAPSTPYKPQSANRLPALHPLTCYSP